MNAAGNRVPRRWRTAAVLALGAVIGTMTVALPANAHVGGTVAHLVGHLKTFFYTKSQSNDRFVNIGEGVARATRISASDNHALPVGTTTIESLSLPAGKYLIEGRSVIQNSSGTDHIVRCNVSPTTSGKDVSKSVPTGTEDTINISEVVSLSATTVVNFSCESFTSTATAFRDVLIAVPITRIVVQ
jgi:hypothetical protein